MKPKHKAKACPNHPHRRGYIVGLCAPCYQVWLEQNPYKERQKIVEAEMCEMGHALTEDNIYRLSNGQIRCVACREYKKNYCTRGHPKTPENLVPKTPGVRKSCRLCKLQLQRERYHKERENNGVTEDKA